MMKVGIIEDDGTTSEQIVDACEEYGILEKDISRFGSLEEFNKWIEKNAVDLIIADLRLGKSQLDRTGWDVIRKVVTSELVPVIIYSAYAGETPPEEYKDLMISRVVKGAGANFNQVLQKIITIKKGLLDEKSSIESVLKDLTLQTISKILHVGNKLEDLDENLLAFIARIRLASYLMNFPPEGKDNIPPEAIFIYPPLELVPESKECVFLGDFLSQRNDVESTELWYVTSPTCDLIFSETREAKIQDVLLLKCYTNYAQMPSLSEKGKADRIRDLKDMSKRGTSKILKCPREIFGSEYIVISFKDYKTTSYDKIQQGITQKKWNRAASLATPYAESLQSLFIRDLSRIGTPNTATSQEEEQWITTFNE